MVGINDILPVAAIEEIHVLPPVGIVERVVAGTALKRIVSRIAFQSVPARPSYQKVLTRFADDPRMQQIVSGTAIQRIAACPAK